MHPAIPRLLRVQYRVHQFNFDPVPPKVEKILMPKLKTKLTDALIRTAKPRTKPYKLYDGDALVLLVRPTGTKVWQFRYRGYDQQWNTHTIGQYPEVGASEARKRCLEAKALKGEGHDPNRAKELKRRENAGSKERSFETLALDWFSKQTWVPKHKKNIESRFNKDVFHAIGKLQIDQVKPGDIILILEKIEKRDAPDVAKRIGQHMEKIFDHAINKGLCDYNPAQGRSSMVKPRRVQHRAYLRDSQLPEFLNRVDQYQGGQIVRLAIKLLTLTFVRPGELREGRWAEIDSDKALWRIPAARMKMKRDHIVPLTAQALEILEELRQRTGHTDFLFPSELNPYKTISNVTLLKALQIMGYVGDNKVHPHGLRATASTILNERGYRSDVIERQLAHAQKNKVRAAYNHAEYLEERVEMMQWWADYLDIRKLEYDAQ